MLTVQIFVLTSNRLIKPDANINLLSRWLLVESPVFVVPIAYSDSANACTSDFFLLPFIDNVLKIDVAGYSA